MTYKFMKQPENVIFSSRSQAEPLLNMTCLPLGHLLLHLALLHPLESHAHACLLGLALLLLLGGLKVAAMTELHEMAGLVDLAGEAAEGLLDGFALADLDLDSGQGGTSTGGGGGGCYVRARTRQPKSSEKVEN